MSNQPVLTVSELNREVRLLIERGFPLIWVEGELSNVARPSSGHLYFTLKDRNAQVRCAMFRNRNQLLRFKPADGQQMLVRARVSLYEPRGDYQLIAEHMEEAGHGALQRAFDELKRKLAAEGLFDEAHKRPLPRFPHRVGVITSPTGAAIRDILSVLRRRFPSLPVLVYPVPVQGEAAAPRIAETLARASARKDCDVLILARGGGSLEDLWAFNEEMVARAIHACEIPVISGVGHEVDVTIADFVADVRAPTPSAAAELVSRSAEDLAQGFARYGERLRGLMSQRLQQADVRLIHLARRLEQRHPAQQLRQQAQRLDELEQRLRRAQQRIRERAGERLARAELHLRRLSPARRVERHGDRLATLTRRLHADMDVGLERRATRLAATARALNTVSPLATLERGYAIVQPEDGKGVIRHVGELAPGQRVRTRLADGTFVSEIRAIEPKTG
ncbi:MAG TPA: exodeoxyribonuclease VII large subunit [Thioalkalivibrio sp.]|nr:exodeoxyribonuclease VII large subunit [Thioalkalivibrio sp.]